MSLLPFIFTVVWLLILCSSLSLVSMNSTGRGVKRGLLEGDIGTQEAERGKGEAGNESNVENRRDIASGR